ncbi:MAG: hypothetical protein IJ233_03440 [Pyramidobacter sp.]|nr:hypothetical protein [Pyramidobacter sp.]MBQ8129428.1 hypothetical protein [Clostridia bacterium]
MLPDAVTQAIRRQDENAEMAALDFQAARADKKPRKSSWSINSPIVGRIEQNDVPRIMTELLPEFALEKNGVRHLAYELKLVRPSTISSFAAGKILMGHETGKLFVNLLERRALKKEKAASAATETTQRSEGTEQSPSPDIVPQSQEEGKDMPAKKPYVKPEIRLESADEELSALRAQLQSADEALKKEQQESAERLIRLEETQAKLEEKTIEAADLRARLKTAEAENEGLRTDLRDSGALHEEIKKQNEELRAAVEEIRREAKRLRQENDAMSVRLMKYQTDDENCGPARVDELECELEDAKGRSLSYLETVCALARRIDNLLGRLDEVRE